MIALLLFVISGVVAEKCWFEPFPDEILFWSGFPYEADDRIKRVIDAIKDYAGVRTQPQKPFMMVQMERDSGSYIVALITKWQEKPRVACYVGEALDHQMLDMKEERQDCNRWINGKCGGKELPDEFKEKWLDYLKSQPRS
ncbi:hypothetical protein Aduo_010227 [Ancylostoma duodenale]